MSARTSRPRTAARVATGTGATLAVATVALAASATGADAADYTVGEGDTLTAIAKRAGTTVARIAADNALADPSRVRVGQVLRLPDPAPAAAPAAAAPAAAPAGSYTVRTGDTVSAIATRHGTTVAAVVAANGLDRRAFIRAGQTLTIPGAGHAAPATAPVAAASTAGSYTVRTGDTVSAIATRHGTTVAAVVAANGLDRRAFIRAGQTLTIPGAGHAAPATAPVAAASTAGSYTVRTGDTVSAIATRHGTTVAAVMAANGLDQRASIRAGQTLTIPGSTAPSTQLVGNTFAGRTYATAVVDAANRNKATLLAAGVPSRATMQAKVAATARDMGVDPALAQAIALQESGFNHSAVSPANAIGTMQVIPSSGEWASDLVGRRLDLLNPDDNVVAGVAILRSLVRTSPDLPTAIASYYQGSASVQRNGMFADTRRYVANVQTLMTRFR
ncbi:Lytic transglycosylase catalytic [Cellulomonas flavigena DSM 20109]|uniref:Lytic transglycosylase catalytic n=1 Tax=Cellulomonas flavigena (strain ATCC 482 / DSM 20109 / BCRC 11376 / JCM 18109 / NBRC 3775 / NCIMB 8073 / NRS 134) TaxID=446466 RepID=D5UFG1_CELFN|nr:LysM peptidoglycan-binding domain-containing protein [Cellulomonas flavigena]ADG74958.1 Lytic transglycosylase catalytic [Cellulomonas flavigena DSM 20109]